MNFGDRGRLAVALGASLVASLGLVAACGDAYVNRDGALDAAVADATEGTSEAGADGASIDAAVRDAPTEATAKDADCAPIVGGFCANLSPAPQFCADFDNGACPILGQFAALSLGTGTTITIDSTHALSQPNALHVLQSPGPSQSTVEWGPVAYVDIPVSGHSLAIDLEFLVTQLPAVAAPQPRFGPIALDATSSGGPLLTFEMENNKSYFQIGNADFSMDGPAVMVSAWHSLSIVIKIADAGSSVSASVDGTALWAAHTISNALVSGQKMKVIPGIAGSNLTQGETWVDNLVVRVTTP